MKPLAMYPLKRIREMNRNCEHQCGKGLGWNDMVNVYEPSFEVPLEGNLQKMLTGSDQNGEGSRCELYNVGHKQTQQSRDKEWCLSHS